MGATLKLKGYETKRNNWYSTIQSDTTYANVCDIYFIPMTPEVPNTVIFVNWI